MYSKGGEEFEVFERNLEEERINCDGWLLGRRRGEIEKFCYGIIEEGFRGNKIFNVDFNRMLCVILYGIFMKFFWFLEN